MRILTVGNMYPPHALGGYELTWRSAVVHLRRRGHEVRVLTSDYRNPGGDGEEDPDVHRELQWYWRDHAFPRLGLRERQALERHNARVFDRHVGELRPEVVNPWAMGGMSLSLLERARRAAIPTVVVVGDDWLVYGPKVDAWMRMFSRRPWAAPLARALTGVATGVDWRYPDRWIFNSETVRRRALTARSELRGTDVAHPGIEPDRFRPAPRPPWRWRLLCLGRIDPRKGVDTAVRALAELPVEATLSIVGTGDTQHLAELRDLAGELGLDARMSFGRVPRSELRQAYGEADALLFPVRWEEPWGLVPLEAMAVGCPVVATGTGGSGEYLRHEENSLLFERDRPDELAASVRRLAGDEGLRQHLREGGLATAARFPESAYNEAIAAAVERAAGYSVR